MYSVFPTFAYIRSKTNLSVRQAANRIGVSHTYLSQLEDFMTIPQPGITNKSGRLLIAEVKEFMLDHSPMIYEHFESLNLEADHSFSSLRHSLWHALITQPDGYGRGPLLTVLLRCFFNDDIKKHKGILFFFPSINEKELYLNDIITDFCKRYYTPDSFRRRKPKGWSGTPPFYNNRAEYGILFKSNNDDKRQIFYSHPTSYYFALFLIYSLLREITISVEGVNCCANKNDNVFKTYHSVYASYFNYAEFFKHPEILGASKIHATFKLTSPIFRAPTFSETLKKDVDDIHLFKIPENAVIRVCVRNPFHPGEWCYCFSSV